MVKANAYVLNVLQARICRKALKRRLRGGFGWGFYRLSKLRTHILHPNFAYVLPYFIIKLCFFTIFCPDTAFLRFFCAVISKSFTFAEKSYIISVTIKKSRWEKWLLKSKEWCLIKICFAGSILRRTALIRTTCGNSSFLKRAKRTTW